MRVPAHGIITLMARDGEFFRSSVVMADHPLAIIPEYKASFTAYGTKVSAAVR